MFFFCFGLCQCASRCIRIVFQQIPGSESSRWMRILLLVQLFLCVRLKYTSWQAHRVVVTVRMAVSFCVPFFIIFILRFFMAATSPRFTCCVERNHEPLEKTARKEGLEDRAQRRTSWASYMVPASERHCCHYPCARETRQGFRRPLRDVSVRAIIGGVYFPVEQIFMPPLSPWLRAKQCLRTSMWRCEGVHLCVCVFGSLHVGKIFHFVPKK